MGVDESNTTYASLCLQTGVMYGLLGGYDG